MRRSVMPGGLRPENNSPAASPFPAVCGVLACAAAYNEKTPGSALQPRIVRGCSCQGPEQQFLYYHTFPNSRIPEFSADNPGADSPLSQVCVPNRDPPYTT